MTSGTIQPLYAVWGVSATEVYAFGYSGTIRRYNGTSWSAMSSGTSAALNAAWGTSGSDIFAVGTSGTILHYNGSTWAVTSTGANSAFSGVWGSSARDVFAVGSNSTILHFDGTSWTPMPTTLPNCSGVWGVGSNDVFVGCSYETILHLRGSAPTLYGGDCLDPLALYCNDTLDPYFGDNSTGYSAMFDSYGSTQACTGARDTTGNEVFYRLDCPVTGDVTVRLTPMEGDLDLIIIANDVGDMQKGCDPTVCVAASHTSGLAIEEVTFPSEKGQRYYAVVDGYAGAVSGYTLEILCAKK